MGSQDELSKLYQQADVCFFSSHHPTGFSRTPLEAIASVCVVLSFGYEGSSEIINGGGTGFVIEPGNLDRAVETINTLLAHPVKYEKIVNDARGFVEKKYTFESYVDSIEHFVLETVNQAN